MQFKVGLTVVDLGLAPLSWVVLLVQLLCMSLLLGF